MPAAIGDESTGDEGDAERGVYDGLELVSLPTTRPSFLPPIYRYTNGMHPQRPATHCTQAHSTYIFVIDTSDEGAAAAARDALLAEIPLGTTEEIIAKGSW